MIDNVTAANKMRQASRLVTIWSPWWGRYLGQVDFAYGNYPGKRITGMSSMVFIVDNNFLAGADLMEIAVALEFALQQSSRNMDGRATTMIARHPGVDHDLVGLAQALEINSDINDKFSQLDKTRWSMLVSRSIDKDHQDFFDVSTPPELPEGSWTSEKMGFEPGLRAEKYLTMLIDMNNQMESDHLDHKSQKHDNDDESSTENQKEDSQSATDDDGSSQDISGKEESHESSDKDEVNRSESEIPSENKGQDQRQEDTVTPAVPDMGTDDDSGSGESAEGNSDDLQQPGEGESRDQSGGSASGTGDEGITSHSEALGESNHTQGHSGSINPSEGHTEPIPSTSQGDEPSSPDSPDKDDDQSHESSPDGAFNTEDDHQSDDAPPSYETMESPSHQSGDSDSDVNDTGSAQTEKSYDRGGGNPSQSGTSQGEESSDTTDSSGDLARGEDESADDIPGDDGDGDGETSDRHADRFESLAEKSRRESNDSGLHQMTIPERPEDTELTGVNQFDKDEIMKELAEDIQDFEQRMPWGAPSAGDDFIQFSGKKLRKPGGAWKKALVGILEPVMSRARMSGISDMSYAARNPNQLKDAPIMMGFISYPPDVTVLIDSSPSMLRDKEKVMSQFVGVLKTFFIRYAQPITVAVGDSNVRYAENSLTPYGRIMREVGKTHRGSSMTFGETVERIAKKGVKYKNRNFDKPDIFIILTDCAFDWPWKDRGAPPASCGNIIVISTEPYEKAEQVLPRWVKNRKNFIYIS